MRKRYKVALAGIVLMLLVAAFFYWAGGSRTAPGQPPLTDLSATSLERFRADFNSASGQTRLVVLLSPT